MDLQLNVVLPFLKGEKFYSISHLKRILYSPYPKIGDDERARCEPIPITFRMRVCCRISIILL